MEGIFCGDCKETIAYLKCFCLERTLFFCRNCFPKHICLPYAHKAGQITLEDYTKQLITCDVCKGHQPNVICICQGKRQRLCHSCISYHINQAPGISHPIEPIEADDFIAQGESLRDYMERKLIVDYLINEARTNINDLEKYKKKLDDIKITLIEHIEMAYEKLLNEINEAEHHIESLIKHIETRAYKKDLEDGDWADNIIKYCKLSNLHIMAKRLKIVHPEINLQQAQEAISNIGKINFIKDPSKLLPTIHFFKKIEKEFNLYLYEVGSDIHKPIKIKVPHHLNLRMSGGWCELPSGQIFYAGGKENSTTYISDAFLVQIPSLEYTKLPDMKIARSFPGMVYHKDGVYVFGGENDNGNLKKCEKYDLIEKTWMDLPDMQSMRSAFTISIVNEKFYIIGDSRVIEIFDPATNTFSHSPISMPESSSYTTTVYIDGCLFVFQDNSCWQIDPVEEKIEKIADIPKSQWWCQFPPIVAGHHSFFTRTDQTLWRFDCEKKIIDKVLRF